MIPELNRRKVRFSEQDFMKSRKKPLGEERENVIKLLRSPLNFI